MKLKDGFFLHDVGGQHMAVSDEYQGLIKMNDTGLFVMEQLMNETTEEAVVNAMCDKYDAPRETLAVDVGGIIAQLRNAGVLDE